jgi:prephenate dehydratase
MAKKIAFQGELGAYSHEACIAARPEHVPLPCPTFEDVITAVRSGAAEFAMLPVENTTYGRVADMHRLLPESGLFINDEVFVRVRINLLALPGVALKDIKVARGHLVILPQCRKFLDAHGIRGETAADNAGAAADIAAANERDAAALASELAGQIHGLDVLQKNIEDQSHNTTRFLVMSAMEAHERRSEKMLTSFVFQVRNIPAALYKAMGGFATNGVNMIKLESYMVGGAFRATQFYADIEGHPEDPEVKRAFDELSFFTDMIRVLGTYPADSGRPL